METQEDNKLNFFSKFYLKLWIILLFFPILFFDKYIDKCKVGQPTH